MKVPDDVLFLHSPEKQPNEEPADGEDNFADFHAGFFTNIIDWGNWNIPDPKFVDIQADQDIVRLSVPLVHLVPVNGFERFFVDGGIAGLGIRHMPVSGGDFGEQG